MHIYLIAYLFYSRYATQNSNRRAARITSYSLPGNRAAEKFDDDADRDNLLERLGNILEETSTPCCSWALIPNHISSFIENRQSPDFYRHTSACGLTGYAVSYNRRHRRYGHLFQKGE